MAGRHRLAVLPGLASRSGTASVAGNDFVTALATVDEDSNNRQLIPLSASNSKLNLREHGRHGWNGFPSIKSGDSEEMIGSHIQQVTSRIGVLEEANKAILEEVYRLQGNVRAADYAKKEALREEKKVQRELMDTIRASNDVIGQLTSRLRKAEEKLHQERENVKNVTVHAKKLEQVLFNAQKEAESQRDTQNSQNGDLRHRVDDLTRRWEKSDRISESIVDEFHQLKNRVDIQSMEFAHLQNETKQRSKRTEDEIKQTKEQAKFQKDSNTLAEQNNLQLRHLLDSRMAETRDAVTELRSRIGQTESDTRSQMQQLSLKITDLHSNITDVSHQRQEEMQSIEKSRQEQHHSEANERIKLQNKIQTAVEEMSEKLLQKEVRLREEAVKKFIDVEKLFQQEEMSRNEFEKQLREDTEARWSMQQRLYVEEIQAMKEMRRSDRTKQVSNLKKVDDCLQILDRKINQDRKSLEKVLLAEITKREVQSSQVASQIDGVQEQLRIAISALQQALGGVQLQATQDKEQLMSQMKTRLSAEEEKLARAITDVDARLTAISMRLTQQDETLETKTNDFKQTMKDEHNLLLRGASEWREATEKEMTSVRNILKELPQEIRETQERLDLLRSDTDTRSSLESESRLKDSDVIKKQIRQLTQRIEEIDSLSIEEKTRQAKVHQDVIAVQGTVAQLEHLSSETKSNLGVRINSEAKMRLEETSSIKRDLARLRVDVQPLLWHHNAMGRTFVKTPMSFLNEWGIYQCARWYDIKMRWLRLLDKSRRRGRKKTPPDAPKSPPSPQTSAPAPSSGPAQPNSPKGSFIEPEDPANPKEQADMSSRGNGSSAEDNPVSSDVDDVTKDDVRDDEMSDGKPESPQPAWYNRDNVQDGDDGKVDEPDRKTSGKTDPTRDSNGERKKPDEESEDVARNREESLPDGESPPRKDSNRSIDSLRSGQPASDASLRQSSGASKTSQNSKGLQNKNGASPGGGSNNSNTSAGRRSKPMRSPVATGGGQSFDMEGTR